MGALRRRNTRASSPVELAWSCQVKRLMTTSRVDMVVALAIVAAIGDVDAEQSQKLVSYLGLNPSVRQSGPGPAYHGRITKQAVATRAACSSSSPGLQREAPGPLRAFFL